MSVFIDILCFEHSVHEVGFLREKHTHASSKHFFLRIHKQLARLFSRLNKRSVHCQCIAHNPHHHHSFITRFIVRLEMFKTATSNSASALLAVLAAIMFVGKVGENANEDNVFHQPIDEATIKTADDDHEAHLRLFERFGYYVTCACYWWSLMTLIRGACNLVKRYLRLLIVVLRGICLLIALFVRCVTFPASRLRRRHERTAINVSISSPVTATFNMVSAPIAIPMVQTASQPTAPQQTAPHLPSTAVEISRLLLT